MTLTIVGLFFFLIPFILIFCFNDKIRAFFYILTFEVILGLFSSIFLQFLGIFNYLNIFIIEVITILVMFLFFLKKNKKIQININWLLILALLVVSFEMWSVHNSYDGKINTISGPKNVENFSYMYPYFSDEWVGASLASYSIESGNLPLVNPLFKNAFFANPMFPFFSYVSYIFLILNLNPFSNYYLLSVLNIILISVFGYLFLRLNNIQKNPAILAILFLPLITNSSDLPVTWYFLPFNLSLIFLILSLISLKMKDKILYALSTFLSVVFYPPIIAFIIPIFLYKIFVYRKIIKNILIKDFKIFLPIFFVLFLLIVFFIKYIIDNDLISYISRTNLDGGGVNYNFIYILPLISIPLILIGIFSLIKSKKYITLIIPLIGSFFWFFYFFTTKIFIIDHPRVVAITSIFLVLISGFGLNYFFTSYNGLKLKAFSCFFVLYFIFNCLYYPIGNDWKKLTLKIINNNKTITKISPAPPVNRYLTEDDLKLFEPYREKVFISVPWKGLVIGSITKNFPLESKGSTITNNFVKYNNFINFGCNNKTEIANKFKLDLVYSSPFSCNNFKAVGTSSEGLVLYSYKK